MSSQSINSFASLNAYKEQWNEFSISFQVRSLDDEFDDENQNPFESDDDSSSSSDENENNNDSDDNKEEKKADNAFENVDSNDTKEKEKEKEKVAKDDARVVGNATYRYNDITSTTEWWWKWSRE